MEGFRKGDKVSVNGVACVVTDATRCIARVVVTALKNTGVWSRGQVVLVDLCDDPSVVVKARR